MDRFKNSEITWHIIIDENISLNGYRVETEVHHVTITLYLDSFDHVNQYRALATQALKRLERQGLQLYSSNPMFERADFRKVENKYLGIGKQKKEPYTETWVDGELYEEGD